MNRHFFPLVLDFLLPSGHNRVEAVSEGPRTLWVAREASEIVVALEETVALDCSIP
jgi:hypothetical protein